MTAISASRCAPIKSCTYLHNYVRQFPLATALRYFLKKDGGVTPPPDQMPLRQKRTGGTSLQIFGIKSQSGGKPHKGFCEE